MGTALVLYFNVNKAAEDPLFFRKTAKSALAASVFVEFFINLFVFGLLAELILQFVLIFRIMVDAYSSQKPEFQQLKKILDALLVGVGFLFLGYTIVQFYAQWTQLDRQVLFLKLALSVWLTIGVLPFIYVLSLCFVYVDPEGDTDATSAFGYKQLMHEPFMGGGLWTSAAIPLALAYNPVLVFGISAGAVALWLLVWALLFRGRLGLG